MGIISKNLKAIFFISSVLATFSFELPSEWYKAGSNPGSYEMGIDKLAGYDGKNVATIKSVKEEIDGFGTLMQDFLAEKYKSKRIRMSGYIKSENVADWAGFWLRVDRKNSYQPLSFDNMENRAVKGTTDWKKYEIVLDVPRNASIIAFGALLSGTGQIWFDNLKFEVVDNSVPVTGKISISVKEPLNLNFEKD